MKYTLREWQKTEKPVSEMIIQASTIEEADGWQKFPIGMSYQYLSYYNLGKTIQIGQHNNDVLCSISVNTDIARRGSTTINRKNIIETLKKTGIQNIHLDPNNYYLSLPDYKFVISPEGNGIDCHRHYEALIAGCIPIMEKNPLIEEKYSNLPILWTTNYSEINKAYLQKKYNEMIDKEYNFAKLFLSGYDNLTKQDIKKCGNYWCKRLKGIIWYK